MNFIVKRIFVLLFLTLLIFVSVGCNKVEERFKNGDIIFHESLSGQSKALKLATKSRYTHVGILFKENGKWIVYEAAQPVKKTAFRKWRWLGKDYHYVVKRYKEQLKENDIKKMKKIAKAYLGINYDLKFLWSDDKMYCSEYVWKIYKRGLNVELCKLKTLKSFDLSNSIVKAKMKQRYKGKIPLNEPMVAPVQLFNSNNLKTIYSN